MQAGPELDTLVNQEIMGLAPSESIPPYSRSMRHLDIVKNKLVEDGFNVSIEDTESNSIVKRVTVNGFTEQGTAPHALCLAGLAAKGVSV